MIIARIPSRKDTKVSRDVIVDEHFVGEVHRIDAEAAGLSLTEQLRNGDRESRSTSEILKFS